ncbi:hypothetical protein TIFTF001_022968 [Ficus carica]|uniref:Uncharacterized protein n=1 Tax=Ficus carica TaxID=3494 RepID=A0AA88AMS5_FICCA|nr:hypothetical protein TIFTF001_022968 [Ficus carica]
MSSLEKIDERGEVRGSWFMAHNNGSTISSPALGSRKCCRRSHGLTGVALSRALIDRKCNLQTARNVAVTNRS